MISLRSVVSLVDGGSTILPVVLHLPSMHYPEDGHESSDDEQHKDAVEDQEDD